MLLRPSMDPQAADIALASFPGRLAAVFIVSLQACHTAACERNTQLLGDMALQCTVVSRPALPLPYVQLLSLYLEECQQCLLAVQQRTVLETDEAMPQILSSLKAVRPHTTFTYEGYLFSLGDFQVPRLSPKTGQQAGAYLL